ncbi:MAG: YdcF family protein [Acidimicrobiales bacterium]
MAVLARIPLIRRLHPILRVLILLVLAIVVYFVVTGVQVWLTSRASDPVHASAIVVMGAAQYDGVPSPDLRARLDEALILYRDGLAPLVVVTGFKEPGDQFTEAQSGARYLELHGVPASAVAEVGGSDSYENLADADVVLRSRGDTTVLITSDPFHEDRSMAIASGLGLVPYPTPTHTSPITGWSSVPYFFKEAIAVGLGRVVGYHELSRFRFGPD